MFSGSIVALVTPFKNGKVDYGKIEELVEYHVKNGTNGIVPCGTTGESPTLNYEEHEEVIRAVVNATKKRIPVIAGTGSNSTDEAVTLSVHAEKIGADACLLVSPYYNRPTQEGLYLHFKKVAESINIPIILYNIQGRTGVNINPETVARLAEIKNIVGIKEASGSIDQTSQIIQLCGKDFLVLSGDDSLTLPIMSVGGKGVISVLANILPKETAEMVSRFLAGDLQGAMELHYKLLPLTKALFIETNPGPIKTAMAMMGVISNELRLPLAQMADANKGVLKKILSDFNLLD